MVRKTPLVRCLPLEKELGGLVYLKLECLQITGSFKLRGAMRAVNALTDEERAQTIKRADFLEWVVNEEDYKTGLGIQAGLASGANTEFMFGRNEPGNQMFHRWVDDLIADTPVSISPTLDNKES